MVATTPLKLISWNSGHTPGSYAVATASDPDVVLLQEAARGDLPDGYRLAAPDLDAEWRTGGYLNRPWRTSILIRDGIDYEPIELAPIDTAGAHHVGISREGSIAAVRLLMDDEPPIIVASAYAAWESPADQSGWIYADASAHRVVSDLSSLVSSQRDHRLIISGDWNILRGYGEGGSTYWRDRYQTVFDRLEAIGLVLVGPFAGRHADGEVDELPPDSTTTPTFWPNGGAPTRQLDFVFASRSIAERVKAVAKNDRSEWSADHCQIAIDVGAAS